jgi:hypothetical protein
MAQQEGSPLVQVMQTPSLVGSHLDMPIAMLQQHIIIPFMIMQQLHMPPAIIEQRFWSIVADMVSSHLHVIFMPPVHFSIVILHRGTIIHCGAAGIPAAVPIGPAPAVPIPGIPIPARSITIAVVIADSSPGVQLREFVTTHFRVASSRCASLCLHTTQIQYQLPKIFRHKQTILLGIVRINCPIRGWPGRTSQAVLTILERTPFIPNQTALLARIEFSQKVQERRKRRNLHSLGFWPPQSLREMTFTTIGPTVGRSNKGLWLFFAPDFNRIMLKFGKSINF